MTYTPIHSSRIARRAVKQGARPVTVSQVTVEKSISESKTTTKQYRLMKRNKDVFIGTVNVQTLRKDRKIYELIASAEDTGQDIICLQEHKFIHEDLTTKEHTFGNWTLITSSAWKNSTNSAIGGMGMLFSPQTYKALETVEMITPRIMIATINGNPRITVISCYSPTNVSDEIEVERFYVNLTSITRQIPKHNFVVIAGDFNTHLGQQDGFKYSYHAQTNRNGVMLKDYLHENNLICLSTKFQKRPGQRWTHSSSNGSKVQLDYVIINRKWKNSAKHYRSFNSFISVESDHRIVSAKVRLSLRANKKKSGQVAPYDWNVIRTNLDIRNTFVIQLSNRFKDLQDSMQTKSTNTTFNYFQSGNRAKLKAFSQKERVKLWEKHFQDLLGKPPQISDEEITPIITDELKIKKGLFTMDELQKAVNSMKNGKACGLDEIPTGVWKLDKFHYTLLELCNFVIWSLKTRSYR